MANAMYDLGREGFAGADIDWDADTIKVTLCDAADYVKNLVTDQFYSIVTGAARVATSGAFTSKTKSLGVQDAADVTLSSVTGDACEELVIWQDTTVEGTSRLIVNIDTATGLPVTPNGTDITITWDSGANKIFKL